MNAQSNPYLALVATVDPKRRNIIRGPKEIASFGKWLGGERIRLQPVWQAHLPNHALGSGES